MYQRWEEEEEEEDLLETEAPAPASPPSTSMPPLASSLFPLARLLLRQFLKFVDRALPSPSPSLLDRLRGREENFV